MMPNVIGWEEEQAAALLADRGYTVSRVLYVSRRGVEDADTTRVIRQRELDGNVAELTVSHFKTRVESNWA